jgi:hypothetical protein
MSQCVIVTERSEQRYKDEKKEEDEKSCPETSWSSCGAPHNILIPHSDKSPAAQAKTAGADTPLFILYTSCPALRPLYLPEISA